MPLSCFLYLSATRALRMYTAHAVQICPDTNRRPNLRIALPQRLNSILSAYITNALIWTFAPSQLFQIGVGFGVALPSLLGSRLLLNLRGAYQRAHRFTPTVSLSHTTRWDHLLATPGTSPGGVAGGQEGVDPSVSMDGHARASWVLSSVHPSASESGFLEGSSAGVGMAL